MWSFRPNPVPCRRARAFLKPSHAIISEQRFPNTVPKHDFHGFSRDIGLKFSRSQFQGFGNTISCLSQDVPKYRRMLSPKKSPWNPGIKWGTKTCINGRFLGISRPWHVALRSFASGNPGVEPENDGTEASSLSPARIKPGSRECEPHQRRNGSHHHLPRLTGHAGQNGRLPVSFRPWRRAPLCSHFVLDIFPIV